MLPLTINIDIEGNSLLSLYLLMFVSVQSCVAQDGMFLELPPDVRILVTGPRIFDRLQPLLFGERGLLRRYSELSKDLNRH